MNESEKYKLLNIENGNVIQLVRYKYMNGLY